MPPRLLPRLMVSSRSMLELRLTAEGDLSRIIDDREGDLPPLKLDEDGPAPARPSSSSSHSSSESVGEIGLDKAPCWASQIRRASDRKTASWTAWPCFCWFLGRLATNAEMQVSQPLCRIKRRDSGSPARSSAVSP